MMNSKIMMNSRMITRLTMAALAATLIPSLASSIAHARESDDRPNIIVFFLDDSGYGDYAHNGNPTIRTPNISRAGAGRDELHPVLCHLSRVQRLPLFAVDRSLSRTFGIGLSG